MLEVLTTLAWYGSYGGGVVGDMFSRWEQAGFFSYILPFLLIFALIFGILLLLVYLYLRKIFTILRVKKKKVKLPSLN